MTRVEHSAVQAENDVLRAQNRLLRSQNRELYDRAEAMMKKAWKLVTTRGFESFEEFKAAIEEEFAREWVRKHGGSVEFIDNGKKE